MQCSVCGSQDTTFKQGVSKSGKNAGKPWKAYDCNEPQCKNEKGYPSRTFVPTPRASKPAPQQSGDFAGIHRKLDIILNALGVKNSIGEVNKEMQVMSEEDSTPF